MTDSELLTGIQQGQNGALAFLYKSHYKMILHFVLNNNGSEDEAKELYQEAIIFFYEKVKSKTLLLQCKISTYLYSVCRRMWLKKLAFKSHYSGSIEDFEAFIQIEERADDFVETDYKAMEASLALLGEPCRTVIVSYYVERQSMQQIGEKMGYANAETAKNQKYKCLMRLKKLFFEWQNSQQEEK